MKLPTSLIIIEGVLKALGWKGRISGHWSKNGKILAVNIIDAWNLETRLE